MKIDPKEEEIRCEWTLNGSQVRGDANCDRIDELIDSHLREIARAPSGWETLYIDPDDGRFWELTYPRGEMHGGGPPLLRHLSGAEAGAKYGEIALSRAGISLR